MMMLSLANLSIYIYVTVIYIQRAGSLNGVEQIVWIDDLDVKFDAPISGITNGREAQQLVVLSGNSIYTISLSTNPPNIHHIAGSSDAGYQEGSGKHALFNYPQGVVLYSYTYAVVSDFANHCLRYVNLDNGLTSTMVGSCRESGFLDGDHAMARFHFPWGIMMVGEHAKGPIVIADMSNHALRRFESGVVTTLIAGGGLIYPHHLYLTNDYIYVTIEHGLIQYQIADNYTTIFGSYHAGSSNSDCLADALFNKPRGIYSWSNKMMIIADFNSNTLKIVDVERNRIRSIGKGVKSMFSETSLSKPNAFFLYNDQLLIGEEYGRIRRVKVSDLIGFTSCPADVSLTVPDGQDGVLFSEGGYNLYLKTGEITLVHTSRSGYLCWQTITITGFEDSSSGGTSEFGSGSGTCTTRENNLAWFGFGIMSVVLITVVFIIGLYTRHIKKTYSIHQEKVDAEKQTTKKTLSIMNKKSKKEDSNISGKDGAKKEPIEDPKPENQEPKEPECVSQPVHDSPLNNERKTPNNSDGVTSPIELTLTGFQTERDSAPGNDLTEVAET